MKFPGMINGKHFQTSADYFKDMWPRLYGGFPDQEMANNYSGYDRSDHWLSNVTQFYNQYNLIGQ